ncbi:MAG: radical SAM protein [Methanomicrobiales archaeon]|nr:radical SAM protein [Methanomicrobiales archaeon]
MPPFRVTRASGIPLVGSLYFGIIDRGTNLLQVRPNCSCNISCPFCSVDAGPGSGTRITSYEVERGYLVQWVRKLAEFKGDGVECHIDSPGEPLLYPEIAPLVQDLKGIPGVRVVSMQSNGTLLSPALIGALESAGLDRVNLSIHALDPGLAKTLAGVSWYDIGQVKKAAQGVAKSTIDLLIAPVYLPGYNDAEIPRIISFAREIGAGNQFCPGDRGREEVAPPRHPEMRALPVRTEHPRDEVPDLVAVLQPGDPWLGEGIGHEAPPRPEGLRDREEGDAPARLPEGGESPGGYPCPRVDPGGDARGGTEPGRLGPGLSEG